MNEDEYSIDSLCEIFLKHDKSVQEQRIKNLEKYPDAEWLKDDFSIAKALHSICRELINLMDKVDGR